LLLLLFLLTSSLRLPCPFTFSFQQVGGAVFVDVGSSLDVMNEITFLGNSLAIEYDRGLWVSEKELLRSCLSLSK